MAKKNFCSITQSFFDLEKKNYTNQPPKTGKNNGGLLSKILL